MKNFLQTLLTGALALAVPCAVLALLLTMPAIGGGSALAVAIPAPSATATAALSRPIAGGEETVVFAGGCFWGVQGVFQHVRGVHSAVSGYAGGSAANAHYGLVGGGDTGHAEAVRVTFDPAQVSYGQLLQVFFSVAHDPTQRNRQGPDRGTQYRSAIFATTETQRQVALRYIAELDAAHVFAAPVVTEVVVGKPFYPAEDYHQDYLTLNPDEPYIRINDLPKVAALQRLHPELYAAEPVLVAAH